MVGLGSTFYFPADSCILKLTALQLLFSGSGGLVSMVEAHLVPIYVL
jgi:hypothetical protein